MRVFMPRFGTLALCLAVIFAHAAALSAEGADSRVAKYRRAYERLKQDYSFERVAKKKIEVDFDDLRGMATPHLYRVPIQVPHDPNLVFLQPDLSISLGTAKDSLGIGFALGNPVQLPDMRNISRSLYRGYQPVVESKWKAGHIALVQTAFCILPGEGQVITGKERQYLIVRMHVTNMSPSTRDLPLMLFIGKMENSQNAAYAPFLAPISRWQSGLLGIRQTGSCLTAKGRALLTWKCNAPTPARFFTKYQSTKVDAPMQLAQCNNCLCFQMQLKPGETRTIDFVIAGTSHLYPESDLSHMEQVTFNAALKRESAHCKRELKPAMSLVTPERRLNEIYKALILSNLGMLVKVPGRPWEKPLQTPEKDHVWAWEFASMAVPMMSVGYTQELEPALRYFVERQNYIGKYSANRGPVSIKGTYSGNILWMNGTGSILWALAEEYRYSRDIKRLETNKHSILAAWDWIQRERALTRDFDKDGKRVDYYGLLPAGQPDDTGGHYYNYTMTDNYTWLGMSQMAKAFREAAFPESALMTREANEYRECILAAIRKTEVTNQATGLLFMPNGVGGRLDDPNWVGNGPIQLYNTGFLRPNDSYFADMTEYTKRRYGFLMGLTEHYSGGTQWYPNQTDCGYFKSFLARNEIQKALLVLFSDLDYGMSQDTFQTSERFRYDNINNYSPLQPNASGNGRLIDMLRRMVIDEQDADSGILWLLRGCPRRWFAKGQSILVKNAPTLFGKMGLATKSDGRRLTVDIECPDRQTPKELRVVLRSPDRRPIAQATANGKPVEVEGDTIILRKPKGHQRVVCTYTANDNQP